MTETSSESEGRIVYRPTPQTIRDSRLAAYLAWLAQRGEAPTDDPGDYAALHAWSIAEPETFWNGLWDWLGLVGERGTGRALDTATMPGASWFPDARLNFAENLLREAIDGDGKRLAIVSLSESRARITRTYDELLAEVGAFQAWLIAQGVEPGDRVAGVVAHTHEPIVAMLACTALGAIWASASPDFGVAGLVDRFAQIEPSILVIVDGYHYGAKTFDRGDRVASLCRAMPSIRRTVVIDNTGRGGALPDEPGVIGWHDALAEYAGSRPAFDRGPFDRPVYILFSSGTTGVPKCIVHGAGGVLLQHGKEIGLHGDVGRNDVFFYFTTCGWMMWNWHVSGLATGACLVTYDGSPGYPDLDALWAMAERESVTHFGTSAKWLAACRNADIRPGERHDLSALRVIFSTGSPLLDADFDWVYERVAADVLLGSISGGTDIVSSFVGCCPSLAVRRGEIQCRLLGVAAEAFDEHGHSVIDEKGELVCTTPLPSMPVGFWNDPDGQRYRQAYFDRFPGVWAHGDFIRFTPSGGAVIYGRSDATLNIGGVRIGTAEIYRQIEPLEAISDCLVATHRDGEDDAMVLFVVLAEGAALDETLIQTVRRTLREQASPRHVPGHIVDVPALPYTRSGKKVEMAVTRLLAGQAIDNTQAIANPESLDTIGKRLQALGLIADTATART